MKQKRELGEVYNFISSYMLKYCDNEKIIKKEDIILILGKLLHIGNKHVRTKILYELEDYGYIVLHSRGSAGISYKILG